MAGCLTFYNESDRNFPPLPLDSPLATLHTGSGGAEVLAGVVRNFTSYDSSLTTRGVVVLVMTWTRLANRKLLRIGQLARVQLGSAQQSDIPEADTSLNQACLSPAHTNTTLVAPDIFKGVDSPSADKRKPNKTNFWHIISQGL